MKKRSERKEPLTSRRKRTIRVVAWIFFSLIAFFLGNALGEYAAMRLPLWSVRFPQFPSIAVPKVAVTWRGWSKPKTPQETNDTGARIQIIGGTLVTIPGSGATPQEREQFLETVRALSKQSNTISISQTCTITPPFPLIKTGSSIELINTSATTHVVAFETGAAKELSPNTSVFSQIEIPPGASAIRCDGTIVGYALIE